MMVVLDEKVNGIARKVIIADDTKSLVEAANYCAGTEHKVTRPEMGRFPYALSLTSFYEDHPELKKYEGNLIIDFREEDANREYRS